MAIFAMQRERDLAMKGSVLLFLRAPREWRRMLMVGIATATFAQAGGIEAAVIYAPQILSGVEPGEEPKSNDVYVFVPSVMCMNTAASCFLRLAYSWGEEGGGGGEEIG
jgi:hypothetical protein